jgi:hypothetical protein
MGGEWGLSGGRKEGAGCMRWRTAMQEWGGAGGAIRQAKRRSSPEHDRRERCSGCSCGPGEFAAPAHLRPGRICGPGESAARASAARANLRPGRICGPGICGPGESAARANLRPGHLRPGRICGPGICGPGESAAQAILRHWGIQAKQCGWRGGRHRWAEGRAQDGDVTVWGMAGSEAVTALNTWWAVGGRLPSGPGRAMHEPLCPLSPTQATPLAAGRPARLIASSQP